MAICKTKDLNNKPLKIAIKTQEELKKICIIFLHNKIRKSLKQKETHLNLQKKLPTSNIYKKRKSLINAPQSFTHKF